MRKSTNVLATLRTLMRLLGFFNPYEDTNSTKLGLTSWFYCVNIILTTMSIQCIVELILDDKKDIGQMCYVISMSGQDFFRHFFTN